MRVIFATERESGPWRRFVEGQDASTNYHRWEWRHVIEQAFGWPTFYLLAEEEGGVRGVLPLVWQKSLLFGNFLCSMPFFSTGGILADDRQTQDLLLAEAIELARKLKVQYLELRHAHRLGFNLPAKTKKVTLVCTVHPNSGRMMEQLSTKMRTNVRRSLKIGLEAEFGRRELLDDFYHIFALKMRELGTPIYGLKFFVKILDAFPTESFICRVRYQGQTVAAAFLTSFRQEMEANWSVSAPQFLSLRPNMFLFWSLLCFAGQRGCRTFDFGRSSLNSGTYHFKLQWGTTPRQLYWDYWSPSGGHALELNPDNPRYRLAILAWRRMPLALTKWLGPRIARCLP